VSLPVASSDDQHACCCFHDIIGDGSELVGFEDADDLRDKPFEDPDVASKTKRDSPRPKGAASMREAETRSQNPAT
jgi:hypothetical protein